MRKAVFGFAVAVVFTLAGGARAEDPWSFHQFQPDSRTRHPQRVCRDGGYRSGRPAIAAELSCHGLSHQSELHRYGAKNHEHH